MGGRGNAAARNTSSGGGITYNDDGTISIKFQQAGESRQYTGTAKLPSGDTYPMFKTYEEADAYMQSEPNYYDAIVNGEALAIFKTGNARKGTQKYVVGYYEDRENKKLPKGYRWSEVIL